MKILKYLLSATVSLVVLNVWFFRFNQSTIYRGGNASNMIEEFAVYGFSETIVYVVGGLKVLAAFGLLIGFIKEKTIVPSASLMAILMSGAIFMHYRVADEAIKYLPAGLMFIFSLGILFLSKKNKKLV
ncbi:MAG: DoxX family protein [Flavobacteriaceae bacterium]|nr:DoxX family protein [Flavobacteriaceae bacterium]